MNTDHTGSDVAEVRDELARTTLSATTMNFIVWIDDPMHRSWVLERATMIGDKHPSRTVVLDACGDREGATLERSDRDCVSHFTVQGERVVVGTKKMTPDELREMTHSLLMPDLPTVLWWSGDHIVGQQHLDALLDIADALVVDSSGRATDAATIVELASFLAKRPTVALRDLAWMRLRPWQDMIAQFFDDARLRKELFSIRRLRIVSGSEAEALYLGGWLGSRLGWTACAHDEFCDRGGVHIPFAYVRDGGIRRVRCIEVETTGTIYVAKVTDDERVVSVKAEGQAPRPERMVPLQAIDNASLLERAILEPATDEIFETALRMVGALLT